MSEASKIKPVWIVCDMEGNVLTDDTGEHREFKTEKAAIKRAKQWIGESADDEAWVYRLSHVVSRPAIDPDVDVVK
jgi:hypothetical protein